jgi:hypothetical protein
MFFIVVLLVNMGTYLILPSVKATRVSVSWIFLLLPTLNAGESMGAVDIFCIYNVFAD